MFAPRALGACYNYLRTFRGEELAPNQEGGCSLAKVLIADSTEKDRVKFRTELQSAGHEVLEATNGDEALKKTVSDPPDLIFMDTTLEVSDGFEVLKALKGNPGTAKIRVIMVAPSRGAPQESMTRQMGAVHYMTKPWDPGLVELMVRALLPRPTAPKRPSAPAEPLGESNEPATFKTGKPDLDLALGGGIPPMSLSVVEGSSLQEKSNFCQQLTRSFLQQGLGVSYFTYLESPRSLVAGIDSFGGNALSHVKGGSLRIHSIEKPVVDEDPDLCLDPERILVLLGAELENVGQASDVSLIDSFDDLANQSRDAVLMRFLSSCQRLRDKSGKSLVLSLPSSRRVRQILARMEQDRRQLGAVLRGSSSKDSSVGLKIFLKG